MTKSRHQTVYFRPRNWDKFQGYTKRGPKWIKLYTALLSDPDFKRDLTDLQQWHCVQIWMLYATVGKELPWDCGYIAAQLQTNPSTIGKTLKALESFGYIELVEKSVAKVSHQKERETEREKESLTTFGTHPPNGGASPSREIDPAKVCFQTGRDLLARYGIDSRKAGALIGKWRKVRSDADLTAILLHAGQTERFDIVPFIEGALRRQVDRPRTFAERNAAKTEDTLQSMLNGEFYNGHDPRPTPGNHEPQHCLPRSSPSQGKGRRHLPKDR